MIEISKYILLITMVISGIFGIFIVISGVLYDVFGVKGIEKLFQLLHISWSYEFFWVVAAIDVVLFLISVFIFTKYY